MSALKAELKKIEKGVRPLCKLKREPSMTLDEWVAGCEPACGGALRGIVSQYKSLRYREAPPSPEQVEAFRASAKAFVRTLRSKQA